jgi:hypothetical protein
MITHIADGPLFNGFIPNQLIKQGNIVWATIRNITSSNAEVWRSSNGGVSFTLKVTEAGSGFSGLCIDAGGRIWWLVSDFDDDETYLYRNDDGSGDSWDLIETFATGFLLWGVNYQVISCHPTDQDVIAIGGLIDSGFEFAKLYTSDDGTNFSEISLPSAEFQYDGVSVKFTFPGTLLAWQSYSDLDFIDHIRLLRSVGPDYTIFDSQELWSSETSSSNIFGFGPVNIVQSLSGVIYIAINIVERSQNQHLSSDNFPFGQDGTILYNGIEFGVSDSYARRTSIGVRVASSIDDGVVWNDILTPFHVLENAWDSEYVNSNLYVPGLVSGIFHDGFSLILFFKPINPISEQKREERVEIIIGNTTWSGQVSFTVAGQTYTVEDIGGSISWTPGTPVVSPPSGLEGSFIGNVGSNGYRAWYIISNIGINQIPHSQLTPFAVDQGSFFKEFTNSPGTPYDGMAVGHRHAYASSPSIKIDGVLPLSQSFSFPQRSWGRNEYPGNIGTHGLGYIWKYDGAWSSEQPALEGISGVSRAIVGIGAMAV